MIGRLHHVVIDCPDPAALAEFCSEFVGLPVTHRSDGWVVIAENDTTQGSPFSLPHHRPPQWPHPDRPQQLHLDVMVDDIDVAESQVLEWARGLSGTCEKLWNDQRSVHGPETEGART